ncbi:DegV family protein [Thermomonas sp.]|uniref:DegV family protein n=1 Tax=Thermomonas sp. TaxID=1971895 RepID=UPI0024874FD3|nr:DegV family protein [Thermomonas sp.]MDI1254114.1 DegV family protein [Thermomonas sp.]
MSIAQAEMLSATPDLTAATLRRALIAGAQRVMASRDELNRINVFPVADGDTGSNLAATLGSVLQGTLSRRSRHIGQLLVGIGNDAIDGARGNSGAIMAQFLFGLAEHARNAPVLDARALAAAVRGGADSARAALAHPVEGTIVSVISAFADALDEAARQQPESPRRGFAQALQRARRALADTPKQMALLQKAGVVDAGAKGFVDWLEGIAEFVEGGPRAVRMQGAVPHAANDAVELQAHVHEDIDPARRYCTECLLLGQGMDREQLQAALGELDIDSLVVAGGASRIRVHGHVGSPQLLFDACAAHGRVESMKADDMLMQQRSVESPHRVAVVTDSASDLPQELAERYGIHVVSARVSLDGRDYLDRLGLTAGEFYRRMATSRQLPITSQPPSGDYRRIFEHVLGHQDSAVYVGLSRPLSGTLQSAEAGARGLTKPLVVFDSGHATTGQALLAWRAGEMAAAGADAATIETELIRLRPLTMTWAMARDISHAVRGGRIPRWAGPAMRWSGLTPIAAVSPDGLLKLVGGLFARRKAADAFAHYLTKRVPKVAGWRLIVGHADALADGERLFAALHERLPVVAGHLVEVGPAIGTHAGPGTLVVGLQPAP